MHCDARPIALFHGRGDQMGKMDATEASIFAVSVRTRCELFALGNECRCPRTADEVQRAVAPAPSRDTPPLGGC